MNEINTMTDEQLLKQMDCSDIGHYCWREEYEKTELIQSWREHSIDDEEFIEAMPCQYAMRYDCNRPN